MDFPKIHESEYRFCLIMWEHEPVTAVELYPSGGEGDKGRRGDNAGMEDR